jgi:predicted GIY-YIG superfamily endonuclease
VISIEEPNDYLRIKPEKVSLLRGLRGGVYFLENRFGEVIYIGKTSNFKRRIREHLNGIGRSSLFCAHIHMVRLYAIKDEFEREIYETYLINKYKPFYNVSKVYDKAEEIEKESELFNEYHRIQSELILLDDEKQELVQFLKGYDDEDSVSEYEDYFDDDDRKMYELGEQLFAIERLKTINTEMKTLRERLKTIKTKFL